MNDSFTEEEAIKKGQIILYIIILVVCIVCIGSILYTILCKN